MGGGVIFGYIDDRNISGIIESTQFNMIYNIIRDTESNEENHEEKNIFHYAVNLDCCGGGVGHWVALSMKIDLNKHNSIDIIYRDPLGNPIPDKILRDFQSKNMNIENVLSITDQDQHDGVSCGRWAATYIKHAHDNYNTEKNFNEMIQRGAQIDYNAIWKNAMRKNGTWNDEELAQNIKDYDNYYESLVGSDAVNCFQDNNSEFKEKLKKTSVIDNELKKNLITSIENVINYPNNKVSNKDIAKMYGLKVEVGKNIGEILKAIDNKDVLRDLFADFGKVEQVLEDEKIAKCIDTEQTPSSKVSSLSVIRQSTLGKDRG